MFGEILKKYKIKQQSLAILLGVSQQSVSRWCCSKNEPSISAIVKMSKYFNIPIEEIVMSIYKNKNNGSEEINLILNGQESIFKEVV